MLRSEKKPRSRLSQIAISSLSLSSILLISNVAHSGDPAAGKEIYNRCMGCHSLSQNRTGPKHCGLFGRKAGTVKDFDYSDAMKNSDIVWNSTTLDAFIKAPLENIPGTAMGYAGVKDDTERADLIAYLKEATQSTDCE